MIRGVAFAAIALTACKSDREHDCAIVRDALGSHPAPRRYLENAPGDPIGRLRGTAWRDEAVRAAFAEKFGPAELGGSATGWIAYPPVVSGSARARSHGLYELCGIER